MGRAINSQTMWIWEGQIGNKHFSVSIDERSHELHWASGISPVEGDEVAQTFNLFLCEGPPYYCPDRILQEIRRRVESVESD